MAVLTIATVLVTRGATGSPLLVQGMNQGFSQQGFMEADTYFDTCCFLSLVVPGSTGAANLPPTTFSEQQAPTLPVLISK